nr:hypothetical protein Iba_chr09aCG14070 [Ipomoea batatas]
MSSVAKSTGSSANVEGRGYGEVPLHHCHGLATIAVGASEKEDEDPWLLLCFDVGLLNIVTLGLLTLLSPLLCSVRRKSEGKSIVVELCYCCWFIVSSPGKQGSDATPLLTIGVMEKTIVVVMPSIFSWSPELLLRCRCPLMEPETAATLCFVRRCIVVLPVPCMPSTSGEGRHAAALHSSGR